MDSQLAQDVATIRQFMVAEAYLREMARSLERVPGYRDRATVLVDLANSLRQDRLDLLARAGFIPPIDAGNAA